MSTTIEQEHGSRMQALVAFTATSFATEHPSPFGASIYDTVSGKLIAQAYDTVIKECDPTAHGEVNAIRQATRKRQQLSLRGCVLYSTCEPCPMCMSACIWAEVDTVVYGASTMADAHPHWPQPSDLEPSELIARVLGEPKVALIPHIEVSLCQQLFQCCEHERRQRNLPLPPNR